MNWELLIVILIFTILFWESILKMLFWSIYQLILVFCFIKNHIKPIELPKYQWYDNVVTFSNIRNKDNQANIKFYATKNWVEIYIKDSANVDYGDSNLISRDNRTESLIVPKWKIIEYKHYELKDLLNTNTSHVLEFIGVSYSDYERYKEWHKK